MKLWWIVVGYNKNSIFNHCLIFQFGPQKSYLVTFVEKGYNFLVKLSIKKLL